MIEATKAYKTSDGMTFLTLEEAQIHALFNVLEPQIDTCKENEVETAILENKDEIIAILKLKPRKTKAAKPAKAVKKPAKTAKETVKDNPLAG